MNTVMPALSAFFTAPFRAQTYRNALYLFLVFPLGLFYFVFLVTGLSLGLGLALLWIGLFLLVGMVAAWYALAAFERWLAISLLRETIPPMAHDDPTGQPLLERLISTVKNPVTWKSLVYLLARMPLGVLIFSVMTTLITLSAALVAAPLYYNTFHPVVDWTVNGAPAPALWVVDTLPEALICSVIGLVIGLISLQVFNGMAWLSGRFSRLMLGNFSQGE
jgi:hypothetical protein